MSKKIALCIGINDYPGSDNDLQGCVNDAMDWATVLQQRGFTVQLMLNEGATKAGMISAIQEHLSAANSGDTVVLTYSGHGTWVPDTSGDEADHRDEALCPWDCITTGEVLTDDELWTLFTDNRRKGVKFVFFSDSCHSGSVSRFMSPLDHFGTSSQRRIRFMPPEHFLRDGALVAALKVEDKPKTVSRSRWSSLLFSGCRDDEYSYDAAFDGRANGAFTYAALEALKDVKEQETYRMYFSRIRAFLPSVDYPQTPQLSGSSEWKFWWPIL